MEKVNIRLYTKNDEEKCLNLIRDSFWNVYRPGCYEHLVFYNIVRSNEIFEDLNFVLEKNEEIIGQVVFVKAKLYSKNKNYDITTFGPICISNEYKRKGYGKYLLDNCLDIANGKGVKVICMEGNIDFYKNCGFDFASKYNIKYDGMEDIDAPFLLTKILDKNYIDLINQKYVYKSPDIYEVSKNAVEKFDKRFNLKEKLVLDSQLFKD